MATPRKFSEKIALHNQKQAEETAAFEQIMREVSDATAKPEDNNPLAQLTFGTTLNSLEGIKRSISARESRGRSVGGGPIRARPNERKMDTSPYSSGPYLSPPPDTSWRRTNSDSALHHSAMQGIVGDCSNLQRRQADSIGSRWSITQKDTIENNDHRPRSSCDVPRVPGINIYPSTQEPGTIQIPIGNNTGSLPDLTSVHFPSPLNTPIDNEADHSSSPYSSSPISASPATLSPTSLPTRQPSARFQFSPGPTARATSPLVSTHQGVTLENNLPSFVDPAEFQQSHYNITNVYQQQCSPPSPSPSHPQPGAGYRSPQTRPSPQSSPGIAAEGGRHSAPCSPAAPHSPLPTDNSYFLNQALLQHHFEQFSMVDSPAVTNNYLENTTQNVQFTQTNTDISNIGGSDAINDGTYFSTSPSAMQYPTGQTSLHTTPNTPTSIPDIILTDFSNAGDDLCRQDLAKELSNVITGTDLFPDELRDGLGPLDFDGLQMLSDPDINVISDNAEDHFRLDRL